jgi:hypothetical protein
MFNCGTFLLQVSIQQKSVAYIIISASFLVRQWLISINPWIRSGVRGGAVGWGTALQAGRSLVRFPME